MTVRFRVYTLIAFMPAGRFSALADHARIERGLDNYWAKVGNYLAEDDFDGVVSTYHPGTTNENS